MKIVATHLMVLIPLGLFCYSIPVSWLNVESAISNSNVYELCSPATSLGVDDVKKEYRESSGLLWEWRMYVGLMTGAMSYSRIYLHIGLSSYDIRRYVMDDGKWDIHM